MTNPDPGGVPVRLYFPDTAIIVPGLVGHSAPSQGRVQPVYAIACVEVTPNSVAELLDPFGNGLRRRVELVGRVGLLNPPFTTLRGIASHPLGVRGAFLWMFIWSLLEH
jgi:hypothetical protein